MLRLHGKHKLACIHKRTRIYSVSSSCILGKLAARLRARPDQLFRLPLGYLEFIGSGCRKFGAIKHMKHGERERGKYHLSAMCHFMQMGNVRGVTPDF